MSEEPKTPEQIIAALRAELAAAKLQIKSDADATEPAIEQMERNYILAQAQQIQREAEAEQGRRSLSMQAQQIQQARAMQAKRREACG